MIDFSKSKLPRFDSGARTLNIMNTLVATLLVLICTVTTSLASDKPVVEAIEASTDVPLQTDPGSDFWSAARSIHLERDKHGIPVPRFRSEVRVRWTKNSLYFLF